MIKKSIIALLVVAAAVVARAEEPLTALVRGQRVNLRAKAELNAEVVGQVTDGDTLRVKSVQESWVEVIPPEGIDLWVSRDLVTDNRVAVSKANVRAGPGINYTVVGTLARGDEVTPKGAFGEWIRIAPFQTASLWVNKDLVEIQYPLPRSVTPPAPVQKVETAPVAVVPSPSPAPPEAMPRPPTAAASRAPAEPPGTAGLDLLALEEQGRVVEVEGILRPAPFVFTRPAEFRLTRMVGTSFETVCFVRGNRAQLLGLRDERLRVRGPQYWVHGAREPVVVIESIQRIVETPAE
jgi:uncharacterized protein YraI